MIRTVGLLAMLVTLTGCARERVTVPDAPVSELVLAAPHRAADSLPAMPNSRVRADSFESALAHLIAGRIARAHTFAEAAGYAVDEKRQDGRRYRILYERSGTGIGPLIVLAVEPLRDLVIEASHPVKDRATDRQALALFLQLGARALIVAGASRCAVRAASPCSGRSRVCGGGRVPYRGSDAAHNTALLFHRAHRLLMRRWPRAVALQPHGFSNPDSPVWFVISDGAAGRRAGGLADRVRDRIRAALGRKDRAVSCQDPADRRIKTRWLCAVTNVQGRHLNGSPNACREKAAQSSRRFLHIEQVDRAVRRGYREDWRNLDGYPGSRAIRDALLRELPCIRPGCTLGATRRRGENRTP